MLPIFFTLLILTAANQCPLSPKYQSHLSSNSFALVPSTTSGAQELSYNSTFEKSLSTPPSVALNIKSFQGQSAAFIQVNITTINISEEQFRFLVESSSESKWKSIKLNILISTRKDIQIGSSSVQNPVFFSDQTFPVQYKPKGQFDKEKIKIKAFISSFEIYSSSGEEIIGIKYKKQQWDNDYINFYFSTFGSSNVKFLQIAIVIFHTHSPGLLYSQSLIEQNFVSTKLQLEIPQHGIKELRSYIVGPISFQIYTNSQISLFADLSDKFTLEIGPNENNQILFYAVNYLIFSVIECGACTHFPYPYENVCRNKCPSNSIERYGRCIPKQCNSGFQKNKEGNCVPKCGENSYFSEKDCICAVGYFWINSKCSKCEDGTLYNYKLGKCFSICGDNANYNPSNKRCYCNSGYYIVNRNGAVGCDQCSADQQYDQNAKRCFGKCPTNQIKTGTGCECRNGYHRLNGKCFKCPLQSQYNALFNTCACLNGKVYDKNLNICVHQISKQCRQNQVFSNGKCVCKPGYNVIGDGCKKCPQNSYFSSDLGHCDCKPGYYFSEGRCTDGNVACYAHQYQVNGKCVCVDGYVRNSNSICIKQVCPQNQALNHHSVCECKPYYRRNSFGYCEYIKCAVDEQFDTNQNRCVSKCSHSQVYDENLQICIPKCQPGHKYNIYTYRCQVQCQTNEHWNGYVCICNPGFQKFYNSCLPICRENQQRVNGICQCKNGYRPINNYCLPISCPAGQIWDSSYQICRTQCQTNEIWNRYACVCTPGYEKNKYQQCVIICPTYQVNVNGKCVCQDGYYSINNNCIPISCNPGFKWDPNVSKCIPICPINSYYNGVKCVCNSNYQEDLHNQCVSKCKQNEKRVSGECVCVSGFRRNANGLCVHIICPVNQYYNENLKSCVDRCPQHQVWIRNTCVCINGYEKYGSNCLPKCNINEKRIGGFCQCISGYVKNNAGICVPKVITCPPGQKANQNNVCVNICVHPNQKWVNGLCLCIEGYTRDFFQNCIPSCGLNQVRVQGTCQCLEGFSKNISNICVKNGPSSCLGGAIVSQVTNQCVCILPQIWIVGRCQVFVNTCGSNAYWNGFGCSCFYGFYMNNGACLPTKNIFECPLNSYFNGISCSCTPGFFPLSTVACSQCPINTHWNGTGCSNTGLNCASGYRWNYDQLVCEPYNPQCKQNELWDGLNCRCKQNYFWITNQCSRCPSGTYYDGIQCTTSQLIKQKCPGPYQFYNGRICVCIKGFFQVGNYCVTCPLYRRWNGYYCQQIVTLSLNDQDQDKFVSNTIAAVLKKKQS